MNLTATTRWRVAAVFFRKMEQELAQAERIAKGDKTAFRELFEKYNSSVLNLCYAIVRNQFDAEDLTQEVFVEVFCSIGSYKGKSKLSTWIYRIAINKSLNFVKKQKVRRIFLGKEKQNEQNRSIAETDWDLREQQYKEYLDKALSRLPAKQRTAFVLYMYEQLPQKEIANIMNCSLASVEVSIHRAKKNMENHIRTFDKDFLGWEK